MSEVPRERAQTLTLTLNGLDVRKRFRGYLGFGVPGSWMFVQVLWSYIGLKVLSSEVMENGPEFRAFRVRGLRCIESPL